MPAHIVLFALDDLRARYGALVPAGADPRHDTTPFRAFRDALLDALAAAARGQAELTMWWEGGYNGYALAVALEPTDAVPGFEDAAARACPIDGARLAPPRSDAYPLGRVAPGWSEVTGDTDGAEVEAPFGAATGHFGAPGMRRIS
ncbi:MAG: hypothetical protein A2V77_02720 [Anaeromyxobacter sp. RBG_16_69_14]|nr:MAG: hypothetical protein A2V77_02720 [Anaeromyxobacter sp. RBG_16_69_14]